MSNPLLIILSPGFPANESDSTCLPLQQSLVLAINKAFPEIEIVVLAFHYPFTKVPYQWHHNRVIPLNGRNKGGWKKKLTGLYGLRILRQLTEGRKPLGILSFWLSEAAMMGYIFNRKRGYRHLVWLLGQDAKPGNRYAHFFKQDPAQLVALSDFIRAEFNTNYGVAPGYMVPPGIDPSVYSPTDQQKDIDILCVGSLIPLKQSEVLIAVVKALLPVFPSLKAVICGDGVEKTKLLQLISMHGLNQHIELIGEKSHSDVLSIMQRTRLLLHPSNYEGFGMVCLEALYAGAHVISFCRPQQAWIRHWHYADDQEEMISLAKEILGADQLDHQPVLVYDIKHTAREFIRLFHS
jgi:glycosyltransferase involved in cell wall biosynthesis